MATIGKLTTFYRLMNEEAVVIIPKVQRDYAYGRNEPKAKSILNGMLDKMLDAVGNNTPEIFDFVYGGAYVGNTGNTGKSAGLTPLDGQQRLTTIFLLTYYASIYQYGVTEEDVEWLKKFRYETRQSASDFCDSLLGDIRSSVLKNYYDENNKRKEDIKIKDLIIDHYKYLPVYDSDPTIQSMLNVLAVIEDKCRQRNIDDLWTRLTTNDDIQFYHLSLQKFGLTDDLYIKMNSRGKKLTTFEIFKSEFERHIKGIDETLKEEISRKIDNEWMDILWDYVYADANIADDDKIRKADEGYMNLFNNIFRIEMFRRKLETEKNRQPSFYEILQTVQDVEDVKSIFDVLATINCAKNNNGIVGLWYSFFYFSDNVIGQETNDDASSTTKEDAKRIRLFWQRPQDRKPVFYLAMDRDLSVPEIVWFYAVYLVNKNGLSYEDSFKCLRGIRNILTATTRVNRANYKLIADFLDEVQSIVNAKGITNAVVNSFNQPAVAEEREKESLEYASIYDELLRYENHNVLQASVGLFLEKYGTDVLPYLKHFEEIFNNQLNDNFNSLRKAIIDANTEYMQYSTSMNGNGTIKRYFIHNYNDLSDFVIKNHERHNQKAILDIIEKLSIKGNVFTGTNPNMDKKSWQYYYVTYDAANRENTSYGMYAWDDFGNKPLEAIILNSSQHSIWNIEWKMLNHILVSELWDDNVKYSLDAHGSSPFKMEKLGVLLTISQNGWIVITPNDKYMEDFSTNDDYEVSKTTYIVSDSDNTGEDAEENKVRNAYLITTKGDIDYIELGKLIVKGIENKYESLSATGEITQEE